LCRSPPLGTALRKASSSVGWFRCTAVAGLLLPDQAARVGCCRRRRRCRCRRRCRVAAVAFGVRVDVPASSSPQPATPRTGRTGKTGQDRSIVIRREYAGNAGQQVKPCVSPHLGPARRGLRGGAVARQIVVLEHVQLQRARTVHLQPAPVRGHQQATVGAPVGPRGVGQLPRARAQLEASSGWRPRCRGRWARHRGPDRLPRPSGCGSPG
jgi:hypothetical protein